MKKITILITEDHKMMSESLAAIIDSDPRFVTIAQCSKGEDAVEKTRTLRPDVVIMDINLPGINGIEASALIKQQSPLTKILGMSMHSNPAYARQMMNAGVMGYITKNSPCEELLFGIVEIMDNRKYVCNEVKNILSVGMLEDFNAEKNVALTNKETEVMHLLKEGLTSKEMALQLNLSAKTVEVHRYNIMKKLKLPNVAAVVNYANQQQMSN